MTATPLATQLARQIADYIRINGLQMGDRLPERKLAEQFRVSRSPIKTALGILERDALIRHEPDKGFLVAALPVLSADAPVKADPPDPEERLYLQIAEDHLAGLLTDRVSENAMMRRYGIKRGQVIRILRRAAEEGWAERLPGHGWAFLPVLASARAFEEAYRFRIIIEPAGILQDTFRLDRPALELARQQQRAIVDGVGYHLSAAELFNSGSRFHEIIMQCSGNAFLIDSLTRLNRLRRLIEYRSIDDRAGWLKRATEHIALVDLLLEGDRQTAADLMRRHLEGGIRAKRFETPEP
ncbi:GntR family transcriptional regulator [Aquabacter sp. CN5-332]|uniref:GntR family transcriptional regulator n=1 Tax=Aquabacter sp. CN5-332 TaxID=3156608 RepID=UPI0032B465A3